MSNFEMGSEREVMAALAKIAMTKQLQQNARVGLLQ